MIKVVIELKDPGECLKNSESRKKKSYYMVKVTTVKTQDKTMKNSYGSRQEHEEHLRLKTRT